MTTEPVDDKSVDAWPCQTRTGRILITARFVRGTLSVYAAGLLFVALMRVGGFTSWDPTLPITLAGLMTVHSSSDWSRSSARHRVALVAGMFLAFAAPAAADFPHHGVWVPVPFELLGSFAAVAIFIAITRLPGFAPPPPVLDEDDDSEGFVASRVWTTDERRHLMGDRPQLILRRRFMAVFYLLFFGTLALFALVLADGGFVTGVWFGGLVAAVACVMSVWCAIRSLAIVVIVDAEGLTVRNVLRTHRILWPAVKSIVSPDEDRFLRLRIERIGKRGVGCTAMTKSVFQRSRRMRGMVRELTELFGPGPAVEPGEQ